MQHGCLNGVLRLAARALALIFTGIFTGGTPLFGLPDGFRALTIGFVLGLPNLVIIVAVPALLAWVIVNKILLGKDFMAVGGNPEAARISCEPVTLTKLSAHMMSGLMAAATAMIQIGRLGAAEPALGTLRELDAIAAVATGGASLMGGRGSIPGTLIGCIILGTLRNGLTLMNVQAFYQLLATGIIFIVAMLIDRADQWQTGVTYGRRAGDWGTDQNASAKPDAAGGKGCRRHSGPARYRRDDAPARSFRRIGRVGCNGGEGRQETGLCGISRVSPRPCRLQRIRYRRPSCGNHAR